MNKVNGIRIFFTLAVLACIGSYQVFHLEKTEERPEIAATAAEEAAKEETEQEKIEEKPLPAIHAPDYKFIIVEEGDYLTVYLSDRSSLYEYTDIRYSDLEDSLKQKIRKGYCIKDEEALFGFLENYSS